MSDASEDKISRGRICFVCGKLRTENCCEYKEDQNAKLLAKGASSLHIKILPAETAKKGGESLAPLDQKANSGSK
jgi:hypothetical protein